ncbi:MAG TPA: hypothetical protein VLJ15_00780 [Gammaproteobacteria bacterium]|nr:hypothetical protein [Gammaproteobacteria bacterium]
MASLPWVPSPRFVGEGKEGGNVNQHTVILLMGAIVLFIVLAVLLPIFQLDQFNG